MPDKPASERTEEATPERLKKAREEGQVAQSQELPSAIMIGALLIGLALLGGGLFQWFTGQVRDGVAIRPPDSIGWGGIGGLLRQKLTSAMAVSAPFLLFAAAASIASSLLSSGWAFSPKAARFRLDRISPVRGMKNLLSMRSVVRLLVSLAKLGVILAIVYYYLRDNLAACCALRWAEPGALLEGTATMVLGLLARMAIGILAIAGIDLLYQRRKYRKDLRMTRQEVKEERRQHELAPELRGRIRAVQMEMVRKRMLQEVPTADVVVTNPTHVAVALRYDAKTMESPLVVAKGGDLLCEKIKDIARTHGVPIVHRPELARAIFKAVDVGQPIPELLFVAVAEVLAMIYRLRKQRGSMT
ncbi:MAG TPA: EscU/YscU/HrcU family type III secretion system export apparatus switch protein [Phycisphaerae bacterium]|nr:EscU/YscU/HrcU family type III secretion system export apparatus switch protein [Phycisphaerae bacterium]